MKVPHKRRRKGSEAAAELRTARLENPLVRLFALRLRNWRKEQGKMLKEVAADLGVSIAIVSEWENGHRFPSIDHLLALTQYTGISASRFFKDLKADNDGESSAPRKGRACGP